MDSDVVYDDETKALLDIIVNEDNLQVQPKTSRTGRTIKMTSVAREAQLSNEQSFSFLTDRKIFKKTRKNVLHKKSYHVPIRKLTSQNVKREKCRKNSEVAVNVSRIVSDDESDNNVIIKKDYYDCEIPDMMEIEGNMLFIFGSKLGLVAHIERERNYMDVIDSIVEMPVIPRVEDVIEESEARSLQLKTLLRKHSSLFEYQSKFDLQALGLAMTLGHQKHPVIDYCKSMKPQSTKVFERQIV